MQTIENVTEAISKIIHPAIDFSLIKLGIVQDIELFDDTLLLTFVFPFIEIPIADKLIKLVTTLIEEMGLKPEYIVRVMKKEEKEAFLRMEKDAWKGSKDELTNSCNQLR